MKAPTVEGARPTVGAVDASGDRHREDAGHLNPTTTRADQRAIIRAARAYAARGWQVLPLLPRSKVPATSHGLDDATADLATIAGWFAEEPRNVGIACAPSALVVVDIDRHLGRADGYTTLADLARELGPLPATPTAITGGGGEHRIFRSPGGDLRGSLGPGIDIKARGYIVAPPSTHPSGEPYRWAPDASPDELELATLPASWVDAMRPRAPSTPPLVIGRAVGDDFYAALATLNQGAILEAISGSPLVNGEAITLGRPNQRAHRAIVIDGAATGGFIDAHGRIAHRSTSTARPDSGPLASTWLRHYGHDDATIRRELIACVAELARFAERRHAPGSSGHRRGDQGVCS